MDVVQRAVGRVALEISVWGVGGRKRSRRGKDQRATCARVYGNDTAPLRLERGARAHRCLPLVAFSKCGRATCLSTARGARSRAPLGLRLLAWLGRAEGGGVRDAEELGGRELLRG